jgi:predicted nucleic acid-binding protein
MRLVTNASPLIFLTKIDALGLLPLCFSEILAPAAVLAEVGLELPDFILRSELSELGQAYVRGAIGRLHRGELEAMVLARETGVELIALDDRSARHRATQMGLRPIGTIGLLLLAHRRRHIQASSVQTKIDQLVNTHGLYLTGAIRDRIRADLASPSGDPRQH